MKVIKIWEPIYRQDIRVIINCSFGDLKKYVLKEFKIIDLSPPNGCNGRAFTLADNSSSAPTIYLVWVEKFDWTIDSQRIMVHELLHTALAVLGDSGVEISKDEDEALAYYYSFLFAECWNKLKPSKKKKK